MFDAGACPAMTIGSARAALLALVELRVVLAALGFDRSASPAIDDRRRRELV
jgi:hypothetical protein